MSIDQLIIMLAGVVGAWITQDRRETVRRWGCIVGLLAQPAWIYAAWSAKQWGMLVVAAGYTVAFLRGVANTWLAVPPREPVKKHPDCPAFCDVCEGDPVMHFPCARRLARKHG